MAGYHETRKVLAVGGAQAREFLQGLVSNDVTRVDQGLVYGALLTPQGKLISDFFLMAQGDQILMDLPQDAAADMLKRLTMYRLRSPVTLEMTDLKVSRGTGAAPEGALADPRDAALGWRLIAQEAVPEDDTDWDALHISRAVPREVDLGPDSYILEMGFERLSGVDFRKGCFVGQEIVARMKHKTELRKGLARVSVSGPAESGSEITAEGKPAGTLLSRAGDEALAYLRFDRATGAMQAGAAEVRLITRAIEPFGE